MLIRDKGQRSFCFDAPLLFPGITVVVANHVIEELQMTGERDTDTIVQFKTCSICTVYSVAGTDACNI